MPRAAGLQDAAGSTGHAEGPSCWKGARGTGVRHCCALCRGPADRPGSGRAAGRGGDAALGRAAAPGRDRGRPGPRGGVRGAGRAHAQAAAFGSSGTGRAQAADGDPDRARRGRGGRGGGHAPGPEPALLHPPGQAAAPAAAQLALHAPARAPAPAHNNTVPHPGDRAAVHAAGPGAAGGHRGQRLVGQAAAAVAGTPRGRPHRGGLRGPAGGGGVGALALRTVDDARAAIIACYLAMEQSLAERGTARSLADTPDEVLSRARARGVVRGTAAARLTALFYEVRSGSPAIRSGRASATRPSRRWTSWRPRSPR